MYTHLITVAQLQEALRLDPAPVVIDCSFDLAQPALGRQQFEAAHVPDALYASLDDDLSDHHGHDQAEPPATGGRHPLPHRHAFTRWLGAMGVGLHTQVVVMDRGGAQYSGRLWWMCKWAGHANVAVLDGGFAAWQATGGAVQTGQARKPTPASLALRAPLRRLVSVSAVAAQLGMAAAAPIVDARAAPRFRGEVEPLDPVAGHIPGALNRPFTDNLQPDGRYKPADELRAQWLALLQGRDAGAVVHHCGSGVTAVPNLLAMELAGFEPTALMAGSWSEWVADRSRPVATGA
jgi:thiosulfate/3-mercaptopyruvate sulfurtransferase